jgi:UrcA family protein
MKESKLIKSVITTFAVIALSVPAIASANSGERLKGVSEKVRYSDLNIEKKADAELLYRRLQAATKRVCGIEAGKMTGAIRVISESRRCYRETLDEAVARLDNDKLSEIHEG